MNSAAQIAPSESSNRGSIFWPQRILGPCPGIREVNFACWALFIAFLVVPLCVVRWIQVREGIGSYTQLNSDFVFFYGDGLIAREYPAVKVYDYDLQQRTFNRIHSSPDAPYGACPYPPFIPLFFSFLAHLSFNAAYFLWMGISLLLYSAGIWVVMSAVFPGERLKLSLILCFALAYSPFLAETLVNGQLSSIAVFGVGMAIFYERREKSFYCGLALGLLSYKPTLLLLLIPMLLLTRRFKMLWGFICGAMALFLICTAYGGLTVWPAWIGLMRSFGNMAGLHGRAVIRLPKYLDLSSVSHMLPGGRTTAGLIVVLAVAAIIATALAYSIWKSRKGPRPVQWLAWAAVLTWTMVLNLYVPIYDSVLVVLAVILTLGALRDLRWTKATEWITFLAVMIFAVSWITEPVAKAHGIQPLTLMLFVLGSAQLYFLNGAVREGRLNSAALS